MKIGKIERNCEKRERRERERDERKIVGEKIGRDIVTWRFKGKYEGVDEEMDGIFDGKGS